MEIYEGRKINGRGIRGKGRKEWERLGNVEIPEEGREGGIEKLERLTGVEEEGGEINRRGARGRGRRLETGREKRKCRSGSGGGTLECRRGRSKIRLDWEARGGEEKQGEEEGEEENMWKKWNSWRKGNTVL